MSIKRLDPSPWQDQACAGVGAALAAGVTIDDIAYGHYAFPTVGEAVHYAAEAALAPTPVA